MSRYEGGGLRVALPEFENRHCAFLRICAWIEPKSAHSKAWLKSAELPMEERAGFLSDRSHWIVRAYLEEKPTRFGRYHLHLDFDQAKFLDEGGRNTTLRREKLESFLGNLDGESLAVLARASFVVPKGEARRVKRQPIQDVPDAFATIRGMDLVYEGVGLLRRFKWQVLYDESIGYLVESYRAPIIVDGNTLSIIFGSLYEVLKRLVLVKKKGTDK